MAMPNRSEAARLRVLAAAGGLALAIGALVYFAARPASPWRLAGLSGIPGLFGSARDWLPSALHSFAFSLFTAAAWRPGTRPCYGACIAWGLIEVLAEFAQHPWLQPHWAALLASAPGQEPPLRQTAAYFLYGTFDVRDVAAAIVGALLAAALLRRLHHAGEPRHAS